MEKFIYVTLLALVLIGLVVWFARAVDPTFMTEEDLLDRGRWCENTGEPLNAAAREFDRRQDEGR